MCSPWCYSFITASQKWWWPARPSILEVGSLNVNGSPRDVCADKYAAYVGIDLTPGPGVDVTCDVEDLLKHPVGQQVYDVVISTEMLEHVHDWKIALFNLMSVVRENGVLVLTTRSPGFEYHPHPEDNWRFVAADFCHIFQANGEEEPFELVQVELDSDKRNGVSCGVGIVVLRKPGPLSLLRERLRTHNVLNVHVHTGERERKEG